LASVSIVIPCHNARAWIRETLDSVGQQHVSDLEVIVVDDGSTDGSADLVAEAFPGVQLVRTECGGPSRARNVGTQRAQGAFIQYLDADDLLGSGKLATQLAELDRTGADVAYGDWYELRPDGRGGFTNGALVQRRIEGNPEVALLSEFWCPPAAYLFRRSIVERVGGWNERLPVIQDARFVLDCALHGGQFVYCPGVAAYYRLHTSGSVSTRDRKAFTRDCFQSAAEVEEWWRQREALNSERSAALVHAYGIVARASFGRDGPTFDAACAALERLAPGYVPASPWHLAVASGLLGYRRAEAAAVHYRQAKQVLGHVLSLGRRAFGRAA
jgi:glycosyltransferase involved in cell wall biosynthesis